MKIISTKTDRKTGARTVTLELEKNENLIAIQDNAFYELGEPLNDVVQGHIITNCRPAVWCSVTQKMLT